MLWPPSANFTELSTRRRKRDPMIESKHRGGASSISGSARKAPGTIGFRREGQRRHGARRERLLALADYQALINGARTGLALAIEQHADFVLGRLTSVEKVTAFRIFQAAWSLATL
jgi:hypothetical protein